MSMTCSWGDTFAEWGKKSGMLSSELNEKEEEEEVVVVVEEVGTDMDIDMDMGA